MTTDYRPDFHARMLKAYDVDEQAENLSHWDQRYTQISPGRFEGALTEAWIGKIQIFRETINQVVRAEGQCWPDSRSFCLPLAMEGTGLFRGQVIGRNSLASMAGGTQMDFRSSPYLDLCSITFEASELQRMACDMAHLELASLLGNDAPVMAISAAAAKRFRLLMTAVFGMLESDAAALGHEAARKMIEQSIRSCVLAALAGTQSSQPMTSTYVSRKLTVDKAVDFVTAHRERMVTLDELCSVLALTRRTMHNGFVEVLGISPQQYLRIFRLHQVRRTLRGSDGTLTIQAAAYDWGFWHLGQFAADYRKLFAELPSATLGRATGRSIYSARAPKRA